MTKTLVSQDQISAWMTSELQKIDECQDCQIRGIVPLQFPDEDGCNWSDSLTVNSGGVPSEILVPHVRRIVAEAKTRFNLE
jgi:hypothetical protein